MPQISTSRLRLYPRLSESYNALRGGTYGEENANLYKRGVNEGSRGELLDAFELLELLDVFGEDVRNGETVAVLLWGMVMIALIVFISELFLVPRI